MSGEDTRVRFQFKPLAIASDVYVEGKKVLGSVQPGTDNLTLAVDQDAEIEFKPANPAVPVGADESVLAEVTSVARPVDLEPKLSDAEADAIFEREISSTDRQEIVDQAIDESAKAAIREAGTLLDQGPTMEKIVEGVGGGAVDLGKVIPLGVDDLSDDDLSDEELEEATRPDDSDPDSE